MRLDAAPPEEFLQEASALGLGDLADALQRQAIQQADGGGDGGGDVLHIVGGGWPFFGIRLGYLLVIF